MQVVIHAGAAFTDDGQLLGSLLANKSTLAQGQIMPLGPRRCRHFVKVISDALSQDEPLLDARKSLTAVLPSEPDAERVILSSDKFFGPRRTALQHGQIYPFAGKRMAFTDQLLENAKVELFVGLVNPGSFIPKILMSLHEQHRQAILDSTDLSCLNWVSMIEDLGDLAPEVQLTLWENEDTPLIWGDIMRAMAGVPDDVALQDEHALLLSLLTETGKQHLLELVQQQNAQDRNTFRDNLVTIFEAHAQPDEIEEELDLPGWNSEIVSAFSELYEQDLAKIETMPNVRILRP
ncbi:hypothetical protein HW561_15550 [Rhodobacteraceae bacterium B1Z28]|uniref:Uncharacterized protein n=1 Tax=Ruegeria haliotis TaxID=2747601 RepID=A0ABX2PSS2_9RHOB|nr:hypothetical protein [Ruegeria haliotis]NVO57207.1 hypothetical protein [Ruegeria haliotis]